MTEDEEFKIMEERQRQADICYRAELESRRFIGGHSAHGMASMSLRQAFEYGYRYGYDDASRGELLTGQKEK
jgi:hypothetical protein